MKTLADAMALRNHVIDVFEHADMHPDPAARKAMLTFVVAGGGFAGVETVAELHDFAYTARRYYPNIHPEEVRVVLVHPGPRLLPEIGERLAEYARKKLSDRGIEILLNTRVRGASEGCVELTNDERLATRTLVWTAGVAPNPLLAGLPCVRNSRGQIRTNQYLEVPGYPGVWAVGDCAEIPDADTGRSCPPTAQHAIREGMAAAINIAAAIRGGHKRAFAYRPLGTLASLGRRSAVAQVLRFNFSGMFAWWLWRTIYLFKLPGLERKARVALDWTLDLLFPRDIVLLKIFKKPTPGETAVEAASGSLTTTQPG